MQLRMPAAVSMIIDVLNVHGYEAYAVGGCVRDSILGRIPDDWDITTSASPYEVKALFNRTVDTGLQHGTVTVLIGKAGYEVTTYRIDGEYEDGRHPKQVQFTASLEEDLKRRDFTINAMAYSPKEGLIDIFDGIGDLQRKVIRCVGMPEKRFEEDALRILRALRFAAQLGFTIEEQTRQAIVRLAPTLERISAERIRTECTKLLTSDRPELWEMVYQTGITAVIMPEFDRIMETPQNTPHHIGTVGRHTLLALSNIEADTLLRWTMLLHDMGKAEARTTDSAGVDHFRGHAKIGQELANQILRRLKFDNDTIRKITRLVYWHDDRPDASMKSVRRAINRVGEDLYPLLLKIQRADMLAQSEYRRTEKMERLNQVGKLYGEIMDQHQCVSLKTLAVTGRDLIAAGIEPGPQLGETLQLLLDLVLEDPERNDREWLLHYVKEQL